MSDIVYQTTHSNTPSIVTSEGTIIAANPLRRAWSIQNVGTNPIFVRLGGTASSTVFHYVIKGGSVDSDGAGGSVNQTEGVVFTGLISIAGTSPKAVALEIAP